MDDKELVARVRAGDAQAERALYDQHVDRVYRLAYRMTGDDDLARDFTQETFIRVFDRIDQFRGAAALSTWLRSVAVTVVLNGLRKVKRFRRREVALEAAEPTGGNPHPTQPDLREKLERAIEALPVKYRMVFVMHDVEGYTHEEIGAAMGVQVGTSKAQLSRARARLRESLAEFAGEWAS
ncbi:MAG: sigma-70 family RNA polymerase sigma factor [Gemmatimonadales bacterium]|nr:sigma-70 family RNA polymerase sigma factor [Gemmatimonadales bacterium]NIN50091.1 sigma-70 family RNA polymerase sigma factor [Gemmatimonadales bacterium]NIP07555.1 sigma-70 family RNA polymerase sigma factor [Gemmatimonadales bacterium]NIR01711.1 sigma-70 family RNA polymerase sigma factor [Gemmatimonadales bacterium]NIS65614.1 sigma-70 family RNA polymerase sigma factor [Gemmatimonadales bacterium]